MAGFVRRSPPSIVEHLLAGKIERERTYIRFSSLFSFSWIIKVYVKATILFAAGNNVLHNVKRLSPTVEIVNPP